MAINAGVVTGDLLFLVLAIAGMAAAARSMGDLFDVLRVAGAAYLVWQGFAYWRTRPRAALRPAGPGVTSGTSGATTPPGYC